MLASMLMESALGGVPMNVAPELLRKYTHEDGASLIAMESAEDIQEIFQEGFYAVESLEFSKQRAAMEGASEDVMEGIADKIKGKAKATITKIKEKLKALWEKVKAFFKNTKTYLLAIFQNGAKFAKANQKMLKGLKLDGFEYETYNYTIEGGCKDMVNSIRAVVVSIMGSMDNKMKSEEGGLKPAYANPLTEHYQKMLTDKFGGATDEESLSEYIWGALRGNAKSASDTITYHGKIDSLVDALIGSQKLSKSFDVLQKTQDDLFKEAIAKCEKGEKADAEKYPAMVAGFREYHSVVTKLSNLCSRITSSAKGAVSEMVRNYMVIVRKALRYKPEKKA